MRRKELNKPEPYSVGVLTPDVPGEKELTKVGVVGLVVRHEVGETIASLMSPNERLVWAETRFCRRFGGDEIVWDILHVFAN